MEHGGLKMPRPRQLRPQGCEVPYFIVADDVFPLKSYIIKPYSRHDVTQEELITNYRISRARRTTENTFGILANVFRLFHTPMLLQPAKVRTVVKAACTLHNYLRQNRPQVVNAAEDEWEMKKFS
jgi:DDE superfamily endonuclease